MSRLRARGTSGKARHVRPGARRAYAATSRSLVPRIAARAALLASGEFRIGVGHGYLHGRYRRQPRQEFPRGEQRGSLSTCDPVTAPTAQPQIHRDRLTVSSDGSHIPVRSTSSMDTSSLCRSYCRVVFGSACAAICWACSSFASGSSRKAVIPVPRKVWLQTPCVMTPPGARPLTTAQARCRSLSALVLGSKERKRRDISVRRFRPPAGASNQG